MACFSVAFSDYGKTKHWSELHHPTSICLRKMEDSGLNKAYSRTENVVMVLCRVGVNGDKFEPVCRPFPTEMENPLSHARNPWSSNEDSCLLKVVQLKQRKGWTAIARELNLVIHDGVPIRNGKQCRERFFNHLDPGLSRTPWTSQEDLSLLLKQQELGNKWSSIAKLMPGRSDNQLKSRFKTLVKKANKLVPKGTDAIKWLIAHLDTQTPN